MAARAAAGRRPVKQQELRRLMRDKKREAPTHKRIQSPLARYNSLGHLSCGLCATPIKNELLWQTHILGKQHKENVAKQKSGIQTPGPSLVHTPSVPPTKRKGTEEETQAVKKAKALCVPTTSNVSGLPADFIDPPSQGFQKTTSSKHSDPSVLAGGSEDEEDDSAEKDDKKDNLDEAPVAATFQKTPDLPAPVQPQSDCSLPADFFDSCAAPVPVSHSGSIRGLEESSKPVERKENTAEALPEGFFDDPVKDAKVRKVDPPKDQMDKEWEEFQKEIRQVNTVSEAIVAEEDEEVRLDRQIEEIDEQIECYRRVEHLRDQQDILKDRLVKTLKGKKDDDVAGSDEEEEFQEFLSGDGRAKGALV
ncbi:zinc finger protein 830 [Callorhinchus milii]|uniref:Zinc finger protein 830 n=1 Tax=Callorhinchus milii TaxID=7868 RepID=K4FYL8_CALMI|nr:zinc finger protein 830 [Callorhinchus milii]AFK11447.1 zinc finger protein [Callorhinchus milii]